MNNLDDILKIINDEHCVIFIAGSSLAGKSTLIRKIRAYIEDNNLDYIGTLEGDDFYKERREKYIRKYLPMMLSKVPNSVFSKGQEDIQNALIESVTKNKITFCNLTHQATGSLFNYIDIAKKADPTVKVGYLFMYITAEQYNKRISSRWNNMSEEDKQKQIIKNKSDYFFKNKILLPEDTNKIDKFIYTAFDAENNFYIKSVKEGVKNE